MNARKHFLTAGIGLLVVIGAVGALGVGGLAIEGRAHADLNDTLSEKMGALLPQGRVQSVDVTDSPAILAARGDRIQQAVMQGHSGGHDVMVIVREYDRETQQAESASWQVEGIAFAPGWTHLIAEDGSFSDRAQTTVDGHDYEVTAAASVSQGAKAPTFVVHVDELTIDGVQLALADAPAAVQRDLRPLTLRRPAGGLDVTVRSVWFDQQGTGVELYAQDVSTLKP